MTTIPVIKSCSYCLVHVPDLVRYGSKPRREIERDPALGTRIAEALRSYGRVCCYPPNQTFIGNISPDELKALPRPWFENDMAADGRGRFGEILDQNSFYGLLKRADVLTPPLFRVHENGRVQIQKSLAANPVLNHLGAWIEAVSPELNKIDAPAKQTGPALAIESGGELFGRFHGDERAEGRDDDNLGPYNLLENCCSKASGAHALSWLLHRAELDPGQIDFVISCGEEACGDRYQRGGGGMAKAIAEMCGCANASGMDIKNFCAAPASAVITAAALVKAGVYRRIAVVGGGSLAKLGMKSQSFLEHGIPILDDCLACFGLLIGEDDGISPVIRLEPGAVGMVPVSAGMADEAVLRHYLLAPLERLGLKCTDIDRFAVELQNPEIMQFAGSGDVAAKNYRKIGAVAVLSGQIERAGMDAWVEKISMTGFAPTQGHIPSAVPYIGHAMEGMRRKEIRRVMFLARASLFLGRCTNLMDGVSFILERNSNC